MNDKLEMPIDQFAEAVAKENARLNEHNEKLKEQTKLYFDAFNKAIARIKTLEAALRNVSTAWDRWQKMSDSNSFTELFACICEAKALEEKPDMSVYKEGYRAVEEAMGHPSPEFWIGDRND